MTEKKYKPTGLCLAWTGDGKGKTTSAIGSTVRALSYGWNILIVQMLKTDCKAFELLQSKFPKQIELKQYGVKKITLPNNLEKTDYELVKEAWDYITEHYEGYDMVILDEVLCTLNLGLFNRTILWTLIEKCRLKKINLVLTGRIWSRSLFHKVVEKKFFVYRM
jgi:cob(I)alamin adenosyltransferase